jgi:hypothetical protein
MPSVYIAPFPSRWETAAVQGEVVLLRVTAAAARGIPPLIAEQETPRLVVISMLCWLYATALVRL